MAPRSYAKSCGHLDCGQYVCCIEREGLWLRLTSRDERSEDCWACAEDRGKAVLEPIRDADMGSATVPQEEPLADKFDRPFEPRLQAPDFEKPEVSRYGIWMNLASDN